MESPTSNIASIFTIVQIAAAEGRFVKVGDVGSAYLNALMPRGSLEKTLYMLIEPKVAKEIIRQDKEIIWLAGLHWYQGYKKQSVRLEQDNQSCMQHVT
jgi:hypothetical protein